MRRLIRVCTVCLNYRTLRVERNSLKSPFRTIFPAYTYRQSTHQYCQCFDYIPNFHRRRHIYTALTSFRLDWKSKWSVIWKSEDHIVLRTFLLVLIMKQTGNNAFSYCTSQFTSAISEYHSTGIRKRYSSIASTNLMFDYFNRHCCLTISQEHSHHVKLYYIWVSNTNLCVETANVRMSVSSIFAWHGSFSLKEIQSWKFKAYIFVTISSQIAFFKNL